MATVKQLPIGVHITVPRLDPNATVQAPAPAPAAGVSTGTKVAVGAAALAGTTLVTVAIISAVTGWTINKLLDRGFDRLTGKKPTRR